MSGPIRQAAAFRCRHIKTDIRRAGLEHAAVIRCDVTSPADQPLFLDSQGRGHGDHGIPKRADRIPARISGGHHVAAAKSQNMLTSVWTQTRVTPPGRRVP